MSTLARILLCKKGMMRFSKLLMVSLLFAGVSCVGIRLVPKEQAARDLRCPVGLVNVQSDMRQRGGGTATGCGRITSYVQKCDGDGHCVFLGGTPALLRGGMPQR